MKNREFVRCVQAISILSPSQVSQMAEEQLAILDAAGVKVTAANSEEIQ
jgi:hypothetical protein